MTPLRARPAGLTQALTLTLSLTLTLTLTPNPKPKPKPNPSPNPDPNPDPDPNPNVPGRAAFAAALARRRPLQPPRPALSLCRGVARVLVV